MITLKVVKRKNPKTKEYAFYPATDSTTPVTLDSVADSITRASTIARPDVVATLSALEEQMILSLLDGKSVRLGTLGSFHLSARTQGEDTADKVTATDILQVRVQFTPSRAMKDALDINSSDTGIKLAFNKQS